MTKERIKHSRRVAEKMREMAKELKPYNEEFHEEMYTLGLIHDMGYETAENKNTYAETSGMNLWRQNYPYWREVFHHGKPTVEYSSIALYLLNVADITTDEFGNDVTAEERLSDIIENDGENSNKYSDILELANSLKILH